MGGAGGARGRVGSGIIDTTPTVGYGCDVVSSSWGRESPSVKLTPVEPARGFVGWVTEENGERPPATTGKSVSELLKVRDGRDFRAIPLGVRIRGRLH
jgi:hypothetical protein